jgi:hypothetical protein
LDSDPTHLAQSAAFDQLDQYFQEDIPALVRQVLAHRVGIVLGRSTQQLRDDFLRIVAHLRDSIVDARRGVFDRTSLESFQLRELESPLAAESITNSNLANIFHVIRSDLNSPAMLNQDQVLEQPQVHDASTEDATIMLSSLPATDPHFDSTWNVAGPGLQESWIHVPGPSGIHLVAGFNSSYTSTPDAETITSTLPPNGPYDMEASSGVDNQWPELSTYSLDSEIDWQLSHMPSDPVVSFNLRDEDFAAELPSSQDNGGESSLADQFAERENFYDSSLSSVSFYNSNVGSDASENLIHRLDDRPQCEDETAKAESLPLHT